jgi:hypothetical protein
VPSRTRLAFALATLIGAGLPLTAASCSSPAPAATPPPAPQAQQQSQPQRPSAAQLAEQQLATMRQALAQEQEFIKGLAAAALAEPRSDAWAKQKEAELRKFSPPKGMAGATLKSVDCRSSKCVLRFQVSTDPGAASEQQAGINYWVAANQPCEYTLTTAPDATKTPGLVRVFLNCAPH